MDGGGRGGDGDAGAIRTDGYGWVKCGEIDRGLLSFRVVNP